MKTPTFMKDAKKIAERAADRKITYDNLWLTRQVDGSFVVNYKMPRTTGWFACNEQIELSSDQAAEYEDWNNERI